MNNELTNPVETTAALRQLPLQCHVLATRLAWRALRSLWSNGENPPAPAPTIHLTIAATHAHGLLLALPFCCS